MPGAYKKPGPRLQRGIGGRVEYPTVLQEKTLLLGKFPEVGFIFIGLEEEEMVKTFWGV